MKEEVRSTKLPCGHAIKEFGEYDEGGEIYVSIENGYAGRCPVCSSRYATDINGWYIKRETVIKL